MNLILRWLLRSLGYLTIIVFLCLVLAHMDGSVYAKQLTEGEVAQAVQTWVRYFTADAKPDAVIERMEPHMEDRNTVAYVAHIAGGGFCLCGQDDFVAPVYLYSPGGTFHPDDPSCQFVLSEIAVRTQVLIEAAGLRSSLFLSHEETLQERQQLWRDLIAGRIPTRKKLERDTAGPDMMELALTSRWKQDHPYNDQCPSLTASERTLVGCQATAFSQIMYYWKWPHTGTGSKTSSYNYRYRTDWDSQPLAVNPDPTKFPWRGRLDWTSADGGKLRMTGYWDESIYGSARQINSTNTNYLTALEALYNRLTTSVFDYYTADFGATTYDWSILEDVHGDPSDPGDLEVAKVCYHAAVANESDFGVDGTGSTWYQVDGPAGGLAQYLRYDGDSTYMSNYSDPLVPNADVMVEEIQWFRPLGMGGGPPNHAWVVFGYNKGTDPWQFKMNMGWGGTSAWYTLDTAIPPKPPIPPTNHLTHIAPAGVVRFVGGGISGDGSPQNPYANVEEAVQNAPNDTETTLIFKAGSDNTFTSASLLIEKPLILKGKNAIIRKN